MIRMIGGALMLCAVFAAALPAVAQNQAVWPVKGKILGKKDKKSEDVSGIACTRQDGFPRACLLIDDEVQSAQMVTLTDGRLQAGGMVKLIDNAYLGRALELDGEGVAYADGFFYVIGSHGHPRKPGDSAKVAARITASSQIIRLKVNPETGEPLPDRDTPDIERSAKLRELLAAQPKLAAFVDKPLDENGVTIEGVAVRDGRLFAGFRGPSVDGAAPVLSVSLNALFGTAAPDAELHLLQVGAGQGVRDLAVFRSGFLVLAGPTGELGRRYEVYWWDPAGDAVKLLGGIDDESGQVKPEAILPLDEGPSQLRVLVLSDGAKEGGPRAFEVARP
jgi:hypothetical protein